MKIAMIYPDNIVKIAMKYPRHCYENHNDITQALL